ncbi:uncharacterized protein LOC110372556 [Helicoverpa armigera]|uniref:uncharacterized protein LOC110372556 n=1 Tax=Helicoverpa armigera TaxID=29058 RepID=UPI0030834C99
MEKLVAVSALVALAIAAPSHLGDGLAPQDWQPQGLTALADIQREKKSPSEPINPVQNTGISHASDVPSVHPETGSTLPTGRSLTLKKPLIVKKTYGYKVFRDSEEEKALADSNETCGRQVKVKLCDGEGNMRTTLKGSTPDGTHIHKTEDDVKHSIRMAKEAVENLQRDLKKMELKSSMKMAHESQSDTELHEDIEVARQALKHIHENFGNLESMSLHATSARDSDAVHDIHVTIAKTEEERIAQWKEAVANIQKNVEIARNIEESFKDASNQESFLHLDQSENASMKTDKHIEESSQSHVVSTEVNHMRLAHDTVMNHHLEHEANDEKLLNKATDETHEIEHIASEKLSSEDNMNMSPSDMIQVNLDNMKTQEPLRSESHKIHDQEKSADTKLELNVKNDKNDLVHEETAADHHHHDGKTSELIEDMTTGQSEHHIMQVPATKPVMEGTQIKLDEEKVTTFKTSENIPETSITSSGVVKPFTTDILEEQKVIDGKMEHHHEQQKNADDMAATDDMIDFLAKSATPLHHDNIENAEIMKEHATPENNDFKHLDNAPKSAEHKEFHSFGKQTENLMLLKSADDISLSGPQNQHMTQHAQLSHIEGHPSMKEAEEHLHHLQHINTGILADDNRHLDEPTMKAADNFDKTWAMKPKQAIHSSLHAFKQLENAPKSADHREFHHFAKQNENLMLPKSADHGLLPDLQKQHAPLSHIESHASMKAAEHMHHLQHVNTGLMAHENRRLDHLPSMRADNFDQELEMTRGLPHGHGIITENTMDHMRNSHLVGHSQIPSKMGLAHDFELASHVQPHLHHPGRFPQNSMMHSSMHEMTGMGSAMHPHFHPSMREASAMEGFASDHMFRWKPTHESARGAYGSGLSGSIGSSGAVGVFPNANTGGCAIPLLLSCSPSVVSGSLAKATSASAGPSSYSAPSYRAEEDFMFHNKRDVKNTNDVRTTTAMRTPTTLKQKTTQTVEKQL